MRAEIYIGILAVCTILLVAGEVYLTFTPP